MTEPHFMPLQPHELASWNEKDREHDRLAAELLPGNKTVLFDALAGAGIAVVIVVFDGCGDSGQIEDIEARAGDAVIALPADEIEIARTVWGSPEIQRNAQSVRDAIETLAYAFLGQTHGGWENNDGAYGEFIFDVSERTITLDYTERYTATESYSHEF